MAIVGERVMQRVGVGTQAQCIEACIVTARLKALAVGLVDLFHNLPAESALQVPRVPRARVLVWLRSFRRRRCLSSSLG